MKPKVMLVVQGEGRGHMTQAIAMNHFLLKNDFTVCCVLVGKSGRREIPSFFTEKFSGTDIVRIESPNFVTKNNRGISIPKTVSHNAGRLRTYLRSAKTLKRKVKEHAPDIIVNFYEPIAGLYAWFNSRKGRPPVVSLAHQYLGLCDGFPWPEGHRSDRMMMDRYTRFTAAGSDRILALSFYPVETAGDERVRVVPPLLRPGVKQLSVTAGNYFLCYLVNAGYRDEIEKWHRENPGVELHVFTDMSSDKEMIEVRPGLFFHRLSDTEFLRYMSGCKGLISTAGFESVCESFYLGKPVFMVPVEGHFEQLCNAHDASKAGVGIFDTHFHISRFMEWLPGFVSKSEKFREWEGEAERLFIQHLREVMKVSAEVPLTESKIVPTGA